VFTASKSQFIEAIKKDKQTYLRFSESEALQDTLSKAFVNKQVNKFVLLGELLSKRKGEFENMPTKVAEVFPEQAADLMDAAMVIRDDTEAKAVPQPKKAIVTPL
jgi:hypothetical protein